MSQWRGRIEEIDDAGDLLPYLERYYQIPVLIVALAFMLWSRVRDWKNLVRDGTVFFSGFDPWYHYRMTSYTVANWPETSPFDPWTYFPYGTHSSQFGTVFDQLMATAALIVGLGSPSDHTIRLVVIFAPAVFGTAVAIPVYLMGKRVGDRFGGILAVGVTALFGSSLVSRGTVGFGDHHIAEALFLAIAVLATMVAVSVAEEEKPVWELVATREVEAVRRPLGWAVVAGVATSLYIWTWPPGVFLIGILGVFYLVHLSSTHAHGDSPEPVALVGAAQMGTTGVLTLAVFEKVNISATSFNIVQPGLALAVAAGCVFIAWFAREWDGGDRLPSDLPDYMFPAAIAGIIAVLAGIVALALPDLFDFFTGQVTRVVGLSTTDTAGTVGEAQSTTIGRLYPRYQFTLLITFIGVALVAVKHFISKPRAELTLLAVLTVFMLLATLTQRRFDYYLGITVAVMTGYVLASVADFTNLFDSIRDIDNWQVVSILAIVLVVFVPLILTPAGAGALSLQESQAGTGPEPTVWNETLGWVQENTPVEGNLFGAGNEMEYLGTFEYTEDFEYEPGFYGVLSWWDYGHYIATMGERIPTANPFQLGATEAANFLLSGSEAQADDVITGLSDGEEAPTRYVMVDWKMMSTQQFYVSGGRPRSLGAKYFAPFEFYDGTLNESDYFQRLYYQPPSRNGQAARYQWFNRHRQPYYNSTVVRLYRFHGSAVRPAPVVLDWDIEPSPGGQGNIRVSRGLNTSFQSMSEARNYTQQDPTSQVGGVGPFPEERVPAMEHYRLVGTSERTAGQRYMLGQRNVALGAQVPGQRPLQTIRYSHPSWVKVFERVPGATIEGEGAPPNTEVQAAVQMNVPRSNSSFVYRQFVTTDENGEFTMTVPYSTTGYDNWGPENGYTNVSVQSTRGYQFRTDTLTNESGAVVRYTGSTQVSEGQVIGVDDDPATVELNESVVLPPQEQTNGSDGQSDGSDGQSGDGQSGDADGDATPTPGGDATATPGGDATATPAGDQSPTPANGSGNVGSPFGLMSLLSVLGPLFGLAVLMVTGRN